MPYPETGDSSRKDYERPKRTCSTGKGIKDCSDKPEAKNIKRRRRCSKGVRKKGQSEYSSEYSADEIPSTPESNPMPSTSKCDQKPSTSRLPGNYEYEGNIESNAEKNIENIVEEKLFIRCAKNYKIAKFLHEKVYPVLDDENKILSQKQKLSIKQVLKKMAEMNKKVTEISNENNDLQERVLQKKIQLRKLMIKRKQLWNMAAKFYEKSKRDPDLKKSEISGSSLGRLSRSSSVDILFSRDSSVDRFSRSSSVDRFSRGSSVDRLSRSSSEDRFLTSHSVDDSEYKVLKEELTARITRIRQLSRFLHLLICFSGVKWAYDKNLLEIVLCTGKIINFDVNVHGLTKYETLLDDVIQRLNCIKI